MGTSSVFICVCMNGCGRGGVEWCCLRGESQVGLCEGVECTLVQRHVRCRTVLDYIDVLIFSTHPKQEQKKRTVKLVVIDVKVLLLFPRS